MRFLYLGVAAAISISSAKGYWSAGAQLQGLIGAIVAIGVFFMVQRSEILPIAMTGGGANPIRWLQQMVSRGSSQFTLVDPEDLHKATIGATVSYLIDFALGLSVWPPVPDVNLLMIGGVTPWDIDLGNIVQIMLCVFGLQFCVGKYLEAGGKLPAFFTNESTAKSN